MFFSSLFDTGTKGLREGQLAQALLQVFALSKDGVVLTPLHAVNSSLILDACAHNGSFRALVEGGRVVFRARYNGSGPRDLLASMLETPNYVFLGAWPELIDKTDERQAAAAYLKGDTVTSGIPSVDERVERARELFSSVDTAIERFGPLRPEASYRRSFKTAFEEQVASMRGAESGTAEEFLCGLSGEGVDHANRTELYREIRKRARTLEIERAATSVVDALSNAFVAESLNMPLHTAYESPIVRCAHSGPVSAGGIIELSDEEAKKVAKLKITWADVKAAVGATEGRRLGSGEVEHAVEQLSEALGKRAVYGPASLEGVADETFTISFDSIKDSVKTEAGIAGGVVGAAVAHHAFVGSVAIVLGGIVAAALAGIVGKAGGSAIERHRIRAAKEVLTSFLDRAG